MVNNSKSKSNAATAELREKLSQIEAQQTDLAGRLATEIGKLVGTLTVELAKLQHQMAKNHDTVMSAVNVLAGDIRKLRPDWDREHERRTPEIPAIEAPKTNGEKHLNTLPWLTGEQIPSEGNHSITFLGNVREWTNVKNQKRITGDFDFNGTKFSYTMVPELYEVVADRAQKQKPIFVKREIYKDNPCVRFVWN